MIDNKSMVAKLLATENITVVQENVPTAMFDVKNRILKFPMWNDITEDTKDHIIGHEVGHALFTPEQGWHDAVVDNTPAFKSYLNIVEDARIEKLIQRKYPGLRRAFIASYRKMMKDGFFGGSIDDINQMNFIDRINVYFKCGMTAGVRFTPEETKWLPRIDAVETWDEVVALVEELYGEEYKKAEKEVETIKNDIEYDMDTDGEGDEETEADDYKNLDDGEEAEEYSEAGGRNITPEDLIKSTTDEELRNNIDENSYQGGGDEVTYHKFRVVPADYAQYVVGYKKIYSYLRGECDLKDTPFMVGEFTESSGNKLDAKSIKCIEEVGGQIYKQWRSENMRSVTHMVKEFEMRKSAAQYNRTQFSKTGVIDTVKMNKYKLTDDIFRKMEMVPEGKNHGFVLYLDMSGSMGPHMYDTVSQLLLLTSFAKQIQVPFRVYGFTNSRIPEMDDHSYTKRTPFNEKVAEERASKNRVEGDLVQCNHALLELFSDKMRKNEFSYMASALLASFMDRTGDWKKRRQWFQGHFLNLHAIFGLGGTPLDSAIMSGIEIAKDFRKSHQIDALHTFFLTDGASHPPMVVNERGEEYQAYLPGQYQYSSRNKSKITITSGNTNRAYPITNSVMREGYIRSGQITDVLLKMYADETGSSVIGYRIEQARAKDIVRTREAMTGKSLAWEAEKKMIKEFRGNGYMKLKNPIGYNECYILSTNSLKAVDNRLDHLLEGSSKARIKTAFKSANSNSKKSRKMLTDLVERVA